MKPSLCLNMIVRNEDARIERCLRSALPYVKAVSILDTGSTDNTKIIISGMCTAFGVPFKIYDGVFENFSQARNEAFHHAQIDIVSGALPFCQFALLMDADMELVVDDLHELMMLDATSASYDMMQKGGTVSYANRRIVNIDCALDPYIGVTHEYIDIPACGMIKSARFIDHADGSNRSDKYERDALLLEAALEKEPTNGRYWYYLANTYRDGNKFDAAIVAYEHRISLGGWDEETHSAMMHLAGCYKAKGDEKAFVAKMIEAYSYRPRRAEPLYDLANYFREKGNNAAALMFAKTGMAIKRPDDVLFVNDFVYEHGLRYEYSIAGFYVDEEKDRAFQVTNDLALDPTCPAYIRASARANLFWYTKPLKDYCPSVRTKQLAISVPAGYTAMNPSITRYYGRQVCNVRCVNYRMDEHGRYLINITGGEANDSNPIDTRNYLVHLTDDLEIEGIPEEIEWPREKPLYHMVTGLEDIRLYQCGEHLMFSACVRELSPQGICQQLRGELFYPYSDRLRVISQEVISEWSDKYEKNWMPVVRGGVDDFVYRLDTIVHPNDGTKVATVNPVKVHVDDISGSSQLVQFNAGWLAVVHEAIAGPDGKRTYWHRFVWFDEDLMLRRISLPFVFEKRQIEFCAGLSITKKGDVLISYGLRDAEAHVAKVAPEEVSSLLWKFHEN